MEDNETMDCTEELVNTICECEGKHCKCENKEAPEVRSAMELMNEDYENMTEEERKYFISALKMRNHELDEIAKRAFEQNKKLNEARHKDLSLMEDTLTFIKTEVGQCLGSVSLAIKNMEREVTKYGN